MADTGVLVERIASQNQIPGGEETAGQGKVTEKEERNVITAPPRTKIPDKFLVDEIDFCTKQHPNLDIIAYVSSAISNVAERNATRTTWANATAQGFALKMATVFVVGRAKTEEEAKIVREESQRYHDIIQMDHEDDYRLLTYKSLASLSWVAQRCQQVPWTLHSDDDIIIDVFGWAKVLQSVDANSKDKFLCNIMTGGKVLREGRWSVDLAEYPASEYPYYCSGGMWILQTKQIPRLLEASKVEPFLWVEDAYICGILRIHAGIKQLQLNDIYKFDFNITHNVERLEEEQQQTKHGVENFILSSHVLPGDITLTGASPRPPFLKHETPRKKQQKMVLSL
ncbi:hypothetical protein C7M84_002602 [Penaeus vannamei]|uniref:Hexosyltransferase n=1 Tax=Penaeus vannamei TaxID=6689 RepID=A0A3R7QUD6_PENVA|nr:hypothetical protein C7M84_002602 [Penaeus vannamei]